jgi:hypothetical protein
MTDALKIATRVRTALGRIVHDRLGDGRMTTRGAELVARFDGEQFTVEVELLTRNADPRPFGYDHLFGERARVDQIRIAEIAAKSVAGLAFVSKDETHVRDLDVWHRRGVAAFIVHTNAGERYMVSATPSR